METGSDAWYAQEINLLFKKDSATDRHSFSNEAGQGVKITTRLNEFNYRITKKFRKLLSMSLEYGEHIIQLNKFVKNILYSLEGEKCRNA